ncbi:MAG: hypothetical protein HYX90_04445 [Chloroflexi bacterium]|nr:hypothetical protein [Chloroflexota bacterium]
MKRLNLWLLFGCYLALALLVACSQAAAPTPTSSTPAPLPTTSPAPKPVPETKPSPSSSPLPTAKPTQTVAPTSFAGKTITIVVALAPGGGTDMMARTYARYLPNYLQGNPTILVRNMPGGVGTIGANFVYGAKPDGLTILAASGSVMVSQLMGAKAVQYDAGKMPIIVSATGGGLFYGRPGLVSTPEDILKAKGIIFGHSPGASGSLFILAKELVNFPTEKVVLAYTGSGDARRAFLAGETNMTYDTGQAYAEILAPYVQKGDIVPLFQTGIFDEKGNIVKDPAFPSNILTVKELYEKVHNKSPSGIEWDAYQGVLALLKNYDAPLLLPPGTPDSILQLYWNATNAMIKDSAFRKIVDPLVGKDAGWQAGEALNKAYRQNFSVMKPETIAWFRSTLAKYGITE